VLNVLALTLSRPLGLAALDNGYGTTGRNIVSFRQVYTVVQ